jgi:hypothetical protein
VIVQKAMDPLSEVFSLLNIRSARCTRLEAGGVWALRFPAKPALKFVAVIRGDCWITLPDVEPARLVGGDTFPSGKCTTLRDRQRPAEGSGKLASRFLTGIIPTLLDMAATTP